MPVELVAVNTTSATSGLQSGYANPQAYIYGDGNQGDWVVILFASRTTINYQYVFNDQNLQVGGWTKIGRYGQMDIGGSYHTVHVFAHKVPAGVQYTGQYADRRYFGETVSGYSSCDTYDYAWAYQFRGADPSTVIQASTVYGNNSGGHNGASVAQPNINANRAGGWLVGITNGGSVAGTLTQRYANGYFTVGDRAVPSKGLVGGDVWPEGNTTAWKWVANFYVQPPNIAPNTPTSLSPSGAQGVNTVTLSAVVSDPEGDNVYAAFETSTDNANWTQRNGSTVGNGGTSTLSFAGAANTTYYLRARTVDSNGGVSGYTATQTYTTNRSPNTPTSLGPTGARGVNTVTLTAVVSDPDGQNVYAAFETSTDNATWTQRNGNTVASGGTSTLSFAGAANTTYYLRARAVDTQGQAGAYAATVTYITNRPPGAPGAFTSPTATFVADGLSDVTAGAATDPDGQAVNYEWDLSVNGGSTWVNKRALSAGVTWSYNYTNEIETTNAQWRVRAHDGALYGPYTTSSTFQIQHTPYVPAVML